MSFDRDTRNKLARMVGDARRRMVADVTDRLRRLGLQDDGALVPLSALPGLSDADKAASELLRDLLTHFAAQEAAASEANRAQAAHARLVREIGFTTLNRLVALRMAEERGLIIESVRNGLSAAGFQLFERIANGSLGTRDETYRAYLESLYDELAVDLPSLFSRTSPESLVFPSEPVLEQVLGLLNDPSVAELWKEDETIGWVYQYYNDPDERKKMRDASQAPRNSRELAVRNQFFTPRYVVEFLTDNTLGRTWYEMRQGDTRLCDDCRYLVRRPTEVFLQPGEAAPESSDHGADLSQEGLLKRPVYVSFRAKKDPRDLKILDPACGSGHFLLYAFDLLETIYEEACADASSPLSEATGHRLGEDYSDVGELRRAIPGLILRHNLHGVDIDPRAVQIAGLALWLRAQRSYRAVGLSGAARPRLTKGNLVVAEPMPGERDLLEQFVARLDPPLIGGLVKLVFTKMELAGEAGTLLKIEDELRDAISSAKVIWQRGPKLQQLALMPDDVRQRPEPMPLELDTSGISDESFWERVEERVIAALREFAAEATNTDAIKRRLFAEDAEQGFAFIDLCGKRFDVVVMNPPFGEPPAPLEAWMKREYRTAYYDLLAAFIERTVTLSSGTVGAIVSEACLYGKYLSDWRKTVLLPRLQWLVDLGDGVLDSALVKAVALVSRDRPLRSIEAWDVVGSEHKALAVQESIDRFRSDRQAAYSHDRRSFVAFPHASLLFKVPADLRSLFSVHQTLHQVAKARGGMTTYDDERFLRLLWEVPADALGRGRRWVPIFKGGNPETFHADIHLVVQWANEGREMRMHNTQLYGSDSQSRRASGYYFCEAVCYARAAGRWFAAKPLYPTTVFAHNGPAVIPGPGIPPMALLAYLNSDPIRYLMLAQAQGGGTRTLHFETGLVDALPWANLTSTNLRALQELGQKAVLLRLLQNSIVETEPSFCVSRFLEVSNLEEGRQDFIELIRRSDLEIQEIVETASTIVEAALSLSASARRFFPPRDQHESVATKRLTDRKEFVKALLSVWLGVIFGRRFDNWNDAKARDYPLVGIFSRPEAATGGTRHLPAVVDDPGHPDDVVRLLVERSAQQFIDIRDAEADLGQTLRVWLRTGFFEWHRQLYSRSKRQAPIYWPLSTASGSYTVWLYYPSLTSDTLFTALNRYILPKIAEVERQLREAADALRIASGREAGRLRERVEELTGFLRELSDLRDDLLRVTALPYRPDHNDGVVINAAPLHKLFRLRKWAKDTREVWQKLERGDYDWAHMAYAIWPDRVREKCCTDRSLAIAHDLEHLYCGPPQGAARKRRVGAAVVTDDDVDE